VLAMFKMHTYSFDQKFYLQLQGGPIGLRSSCCVARLVMLWWDDKLVEAMQKMNLSKVVGARYMDDIRVWMHAIRLGWRVVGGEMIYRKEWRMEELLMGMTSLQKTTEILKEIMNGICGWLNLTMETEEMFGGWLPTLDLEIIGQADLVSLNVTLRTCTYMYYLGRHEGYSFVGIGVLFSFLISPLHIWYVG
jgi:hypothetical protein